MSEVKTEPVKARFIDKQEEFFTEDFTAREPGTLWIDADVHYDDGSIYVWYGCPCGCGHAGAIRIKEGDKPTVAPSWAWNGSKEAAVLSPSVHHVGHWHGWLGGSSGQSPGMWVTA